MRIWYHAPGKVREALRPGFHTVDLRSFCLFAPPSFFGGFVQRHPGLTRRLVQIDDRLGATWPFRLMGDFYALVARYDG
jgi:hypothetical protein